MATIERPELAIIGLAPEGGGLGLASSADSGSDLEPSLTGGRGGSTTFATSRGGSGACAGGCDGRVFISSPGLAGRIASLLLISLQGLPASLKG